MGKWVTVAKVKDISRGRGQAVRCGVHTLAVFNVEGTFYAVNNLCPHVAGPLYQGAVIDCVVICPWHGWRFPLSPDDPPNDGLRRYRVQISDGEIQVEVPEEPE